MNRTSWILLAAIVALLAAFSAGWFYGSRGVAEQRAQERDVALSLSDARGALLEGRLELYSNNFGNAARHFDTAKRKLGPAIEVLDREKAAEQAASLRQAVTSIDAAIQRAGRLEPSAHESAAAAQKVIDTVIEQRQPVR